jgi:hypothetical protein
VLALRLSLHIGRISACSGDQVTGPLCKRYTGTGAGWLSGFRRSGAGDFRISCRNLVIVPSQYSFTIGQRLGLSLRRWSSESSRKEADFAILHRGGGLPRGGGGSWRELPAVTGGQGGLPICRGLKPRRGQQAFYEGVTEGSLPPRKYRISPHSSRRGLLAGVRESAGRRTWTPQSRAPPKGTFRIGEGWDPRSLTTTVGLSVDVVPAVATEMFHLAHRTGWIRGSRNSRRGGVDRGKELLGRVFSGETDPSGNRIFLGVSPSCISA